MYNLKNVYSIIGFESKNIKVLISDNTSDTPHCLYFSSLPYSGFNAQGLFDLQSVRKILMAELVKIEKFIGAKINGSFLNIPNLQISQTVKTIENRNFANEYDLLSFLENQPNENNSYVLKNVVNKYILKDRIEASFPNRAKNFMIEYTSYCAPNSVITQCMTLFNELGIQIFGFYNNSFAMREAFNKENHNKLLIDVCEDGVNLTSYGLDNTINRSIKVDCGTNWLKNPIKQKLLINSDDKIDSLVNSLRLINTMENDPIFINHHLDSYLSTNQCSIKSLYGLLKNTIIKQIDRISSQFPDSHFSEVVLTCCNSFNTIYKLINDTVGLNINGTRIRMLETNTLGLENENISYLQLAIANGISENSTLQKEQRFSIDPFVAEDISSKQYKQNIIIKLGIISTNFAAKLGQQWE